MNKILITGVDGFIGGYLHSHLQSRDYYLICLVKTYSPNLAQYTNYKCKFVIGNIEDNTFINSIDFEIDYIIHFAGKNDIGESFSNPYSTINTNTFGTLNLIELARAKNVKKFIYISSANVYGKPHYIPVDESHPIQLNSPYSLSKLLSENILKYYYNHYDVKFVILRLFNVFGKNQNSRTVITDLLKKLSIPNVEKIILKSPNNERDFIFIDDVCEIITEIMENNTCIAETLNVGSGCATKIIDVYKTVIKLLNSPVSLILENDENAEIYSICSNNDNLFKFIKKRTMTSFEEGMKLVLESKCESS
ncbi:WcaG Nucleoside-diphosphate-sugar epimerases [Candidatus Methylopumilus planktonicus]|uniref:NAD-dependent epimerase/dehydratase family protein n=1 Tax=Candidatus Methylopumilus planktonicus TaxID=1581557 RepID=UPI003BEEFDCD